MKHGETVAGAHGQHRLRCSSPGHVLACRTFDAAIRLAVGTFRWIRESPRRSSNSPATEPRNRTGQRVRRSQKQRRPIHVRGHARRCAFSQDNTMRQDHCLRIQALARASPHSPNPTRPFRQFNMRMSPLGGGPPRAARKIPSRAVGAAAYVRMHAESCRRFGLDTASSLIGRCGRGWEESDAPPADRSSPKRSGGVDDFGSAPQVGGRDPGPLQFAAAAVATSRARPDVT